MAITYGVTPTGFVRPRLIDLQQQINNSLVTTFGAATNTNAAAVFGQISGIIAGQLDIAWQAEEDTYNSQYPDTAFGVSLDNVGALSGIPRLGALPSRVLSVRLFGTPGTLVPAGTQFSVLNSPTSIFTTDAPVTLVDGQDTIQSLTFSTVPASGQWQLSFNGQTTVLLGFAASALTIQNAIAVLPFAAGVIVSGNYSIGFTVDFSGVSGLQSWPAMVVTFNTLADSLSVPVMIGVTITQAGIDQGDVNVTATTTTTGPILANAGTLTIIVNPVAGLNSVNNITDALIGRNTETDNAYRARREITLQVAGAGTPEAIRSRLLSVTGVTAAIVFENDTDIVDPSGRPPHSFESVVQGGDTQTIIDLLWQIKPAGIQTDGTTSGTALDSSGQPHTINFSRPTAIPIYVKLTITKNTSFPANGAATAAQDIVDAGNALGIGKEVVTIPYLISSIAGIPGIENAVLLISTSPGPTSPANIPIAINQVATFQTLNVQIITL